MGVLARNDCGVFLTGIAAMEVAAPKTTKKGGRLMVGRIRAVDYSSIPCCFLRRAVDERILPDGTHS